MSHQDPNAILKTLKRRLNVVGVIITAALFMGIAWFYWGPMSREATEYKQHLDNLRALIKEENRLREEHAALRQQLDRAAQQEAAIQKQIPHGPQEAEFLAQISQAAAEEGMQIVDYRPGVISSGEACSTLRVALACEGTYQAICTFLDRLQKLSRCSTVIRMEIEPSASPKHYATKLSLELYFFSDNSTFATK
jgi:Tfp pilus assembly protein PilO